MATVTKKVVARSIQQGTGTSYNQAYQCLKTTLGIIKTTLAGGEDVMVSGFGKFKVREKSARKGRNPATGESVMLKPRRVVTFSCSGTLRLLYLVVVITVFLTPASAFAEAKTIHATHKYVMGDNDSKNDARHMCFLEAKRKVIEKAGTYVESITKAINFEVSKDEINSFSAALISVETVKENWLMSGNNMAIEITVKAKVDTDRFKKQLAKIRDNDVLQGKIKSQQQRLVELEKTVASLQNQLGKMDAPKAATLRKERNVVFKQIDELEQKKIQIVKKVQKRTRDAKKLITTGMTKRDVYSLLGQPDGADCSLGIYHRICNHWYYGASTVIFNNGGIVRHVQ